MLSRRGDLYPGWSRSCSPWSTFQRIVTRSARTSRLFLFVLGLGAFVFAAIPLESSPVAAERAPADDRVIYLTYDDGPHPSVTPQLLDLLDDYDAKATFFVVGKWTELYPDIVVDAHRRGHSIQNHTWDHPQLTQVSDERLIEQIQRSQDRIVELTGVAPGCLRPPFGDTDGRVERIVASQGLVHLLWDVSAQDWRQPGVNVIVDSIRSGTPPASNILLHDGPFSQPRQQVVEATRLLLDHYAELGYRFEVLPQCGPADPPADDEPPSAVDDPSDPVGSDADPAVGSGGGGPDGPGGEPASSGGSGGGSRLVVRVAGASGEELVRVSVDGVVVLSFVASGSSSLWGAPVWVDHEYVHSGVLVPSQVRVSFVNDGRSVSGGGRDVRVDYISIDGVRFETEGSSVVSTGSWGNGSRCTPGSWLLDNLVCNGYFHYGHQAASANVPPEAIAGDDVTVIDVDGTGSETISFEGGASLDEDGSIAEYRWTSNGALLATGSNPAVDLDVGIHEVTLTVTDDDGETDTDTIVVTVGSPPAPEDVGVGEAEPVLDPVAPGGGSRLVVRVAGASGEELVRVSVDGVVVLSFVASGSSSLWGAPVWVDHEYVHSGVLVPSQVRVSFVNDGRSVSGGGRDVRVDYISIDGVRFETEGSSVVSTGSWGNGSRCTPGSWQLDNLACNGYFQY